MACLRNRAKGRDEVNHKDWHPTALAALLVDGDDVFGGITIGFLEVSEQETTGKRIKIQTENAA